MGEAPSYFALLPDDLQQLVSDFYQKNTMPENPLETYKHLKREEQFAKTYMDPDEYVYPIAGGPYNPRKEKLEEIASDRRALGRKARRLNRVKLYIKKKKPQNVI